MNAGMPSFLVAVASAVCAFAASAGGLPRWQIACLFLLLGLLNMIIAVHLVDSSGARWEVR